MSRLLAGAAFAAGLLAAPSPDGAKLMVPHVADLTLTLRTTSDPDFAATRVLDAEVGSWYGSVECVRYFSVVDPSGSHHTVSRRFHIST
jgi:hypothetical protein